MDERRSEPRARRLKPGRVIFNNRQSVMDCQLRDVSTRGARLNCVNTLGLPDEFQVTLPGIAENRWARLAWSKYGEIGVEFI